VGKVIQTSDLKKTTSALVEQIENGLITSEQATHKLNNGSFDNNIFKLAEERAKVESLGLTLGKQADTANMVDQEANTDKTQE
jgi:hypothetical protein